jgi:hypothetical protein
MPPPKADPPLAESRRLRSCAASLQAAVAAQFNAAREVSIPPKYLGKRSITKERASLDFLKNNASI